MADYIAILQSELTTDELTRGYSGMTDQQAADDLNTVYRQINRTSMTGSEVLNAVVKSEYDLLVPTDQAMFWNIIHIGDINPFGIEATIMISIFGGGSDTITALAALRKRDVSRAEELGIPFVKAGHVEEARA